MLRTLHQLLSRSPSKTEETGEHRLQVATAALFLEMTRADFEEAPEERGQALAALSATFDLSGEEAEALAKQADEQSRDSVELFQFTRVVDKDLSPEEKVDVIQRLWEVAFADERIDEQEEYLVRKVAGLLHVAHGDFIAAKKRARKHFESR